MGILISSLRNLDAETIELKRSEKNYKVLVSPEVEVEGEIYQVLMDGHHSYEAAKLDGVTPEIVVATCNTHPDIFGVDCPQLRHSPAEFLQSQYCDSDWFYAETGRNVWQ